jgi:hypothetical protein
VRNNPGTAGTKPIYETARGPAPAEEAAGALTDSQLAPIVAAAKLLWAQALGADDGRLAALGGARVEVGNLPEGKVGDTIGNLVLIDRTAAGRGWFVDATPGENEEFIGHGPGGELVATRSSPAYGLMDLLTVVLHELGHVQGLDHDERPGHEHGLMAEALSTGERRLPGSPEAAAVTAPAPAAAVPPARQSEGPRRAAGFRSGHAAAHTILIPATGTLGNVPSAMVTFEVHATVGGLITAIKDGTAAGRITSNTNQLLTKLQAAQAALARNDLASARSMLAVFINQVRSQAGKGIDAGYAALLVNLTDDLLGRL